MRMLLEQFPSRLELKITVQNHIPYIVFSSLMRKYEPASSPTNFLFMAGYRNLHTFGFFPVICRSYLQTEISVTLSIGNKLYSRHHLLFFSFLWNHFLMLSCDRIESAQFIHDTLSLAKLVYYNIAEKVITVKGKQS